MIRGTSGSAPASADTPVDDPASRNIADRSIVVKGRVGECVAVAVGLGLRLVPLGETARPVADSVVSDEEASWRAEAGNEGARRP